MKRPKNFLIYAVLLSVLAVAVAVAIHAARERPAVTQNPSAQEVDSRPRSPAVGSASVAPTGTPSDATRKRAQDFNDATNRFNAPDEQPR